MARKLKMTKACVAARKRYRAKKTARGGCPGKRGGFFGRIGNARRRRAKVEARGGRIFHKYPKVSKTESRRLAQQKKSRAAAKARVWGLLRSNKGGVSRHRRR